MSSERLSKEVTSFGQDCVLACDGNCQKAWGVNNRPKKQIDPNNDDDFAYLADNELGEAPTDPGTYEGGHAKPQSPEARLNKWCARECERSVIEKPGQEINLPDFRERVFNIVKD